MTEFLTRKCRNINKIIMMYSKLFIWHEHTVIIYIFIEANKAFLIAEKWSQVLVFSVFLHCRLKWALLITGDRFHRHHSEHSAKHFIHLYSSPSQTTVLFNTSVLLWYKLYLSHAGVAAFQGTVWDHSGKRLCSPHQPLL